MNTVKEKNLKLINDSLNSSLAMNDELLHVKIELNRELNQDQIMNLMGRLHMKVDMALFKEKLSKVSVKERSKFVVLTGYLTDKITLDIFIQTRNNSHCYRKIKDIWLKTCRNSDLKLVVDSFTPEARQHGISRELWELMTVPTFFQVSKINDLETLEKKLVDIINCTDEFFVFTSDQFKISGLN